MKEEDYESLSLEELNDKLKALQKQSSDFYNEEQAVKLTLNSIYGALGNQYFSLFNPDVAESVTLQGQDIWKFAEKIVNRYFNEIWHLDTELHEKMEVRNARKITLDMVCYGDTDSVFSGSKLLIMNDIGEKKEILIEDFFNNLAEYEEIFVDHKGNHIIETKGFSSANYKNEKIEYSGIKKIIRHKVRKPKWKITTESGKEVIVTNDHSVTVFRDDKKIHIKPSEINLDTDKILSIDIDI
jgi:DNA polymerase elongation subunit (family B)